MALILPQNPNTFPSVYCIETTWFISLVLNLPYDFGTVFFGYTREQLAPRRLAADQLNATETTWFISLVLNLPYDFGTVFLGYMWEQLAATGSARFILYPRFVTRIIQRLLPDIPPPRLLHDVNEAGGIRTRSYCNSRRAGDPPHLFLIGHLVDPDFTYRGQIPPLPKEAQPPPQQGAPPPPPRRAQCRAPRRAPTPLPPPPPGPPPPGARRVDQPEDSDDEDHIPINQRRAAVEAHLERQATPIRQGIVEDAFGARERFGDDVVEREVETVVHQVLSAELTSAERYIRQIAREDPLPLISPLHLSLLNLGQDRPGPSQRADSTESSMMSRLGGDGPSRDTEPMPFDEPAGEATNVPMTQAERNDPPAVEFEMDEELVQEPIGAEFDINVGDIEMEEPGATRDMSLNTTDFNVVLQEGMQAFSDLDREVAAKAEGEMGVVTFAPEKPRKKRKLVHTASETAAPSSSFSTTQPLEIQQTL